MKTEIIALDCTIDENVDPVILMEMREKLNPRKAFSYADGDHIKGQEEDEKRMREPNKPYARLKKRTNNTGENNG